jgi:hypothetical protein
MIDLSAYEGPIATERYFGAGSGQAPGLLINALSAHTRSVIVLNGLEGADPTIRSRLVAGLRDGFIEGTDGRPLSLRGTTVVLAQPMMSGGDRAPVGFGAGPREDATSAPLPPSLGALCDVCLSFEAARDRKLLREATRIVQDLEKRGVVAPVPDDILCGLAQLSDDAARREMRRRLHAAARATLVSG